MMSAPERLRQRAVAIADDVEKQIKDDGGEVIGTITEIRRHLGLNCPNNELREALGFLVKEGRMRGAPLDSLTQSRGLPHKMYRYVALVPATASDGVNV